MDWTLLLISALIFTTIGYVAGGLVTMLRNKDTAEENPPIDRSEKPQEEHQPAGGKSFVPFLGVFRDQKNSLLRIDLNGKPVVASNALTPDLMAELRRVHSDLNAWMGEPIPPLVMEPSNRVAISSPVSAPMASQAVRQTGPLAARLVNAVPPPVLLETEVVTPTSMVAQIDEILQKIITGTELEKPGIKLVENPTHGVEVWVGAIKYEGVDQVPEETVKKVIRSAVKIWEDRRLA